MDLIGKRLQNDAEIEDLKAQVKAEAEKVNKESIEKANLRKE